MQKLLQGVNIFLIGMMGSGKTTIGEVLARQLGYRFFDTDVLIERVMQKSIREIFATVGEDKFREIETQVLAQLAAYTHCVIATGGGIVLRPINWSYLHHGLIIWLDVPLELLRQRLVDDTKRPLLQETALTAKLESLLEQRRSLYAQADIQLFTENNQTPEQTISQLWECLPTVLKANQRVPFDIVKDSGKVLDNIVEPSINREDWEALE